jgi:hypothetical protein
MSGLRIFHHFSTLFVTFQVSRIEGGDGGRLAESRRPLACPVLLASAQQQFAPLENVSVSWQTSFVKKIVCRKTHSPVDPDKDSLPKNSLPR